MSTPRRLLLVPALAIAALTACGSTSTPRTSSTSLVPGVTTAPAGAATSDLSPGTTGDTPASDPTPTIAGADAEIIVHVGLDDAATTGSRVEHVNAGQEVVLRLTSDGDEDYVVAGYGIERKMAAGVEAQFNFTADKKGSFEVQSNVTHKVYLVLEVS